MTLAPEQQLERFEKELRQEQQNDLLKSRLPKNDTNRDMINRMTNEEFAYWVINTAPKIGKRYTSSVGGLEVWLGEQEENDG